MKNRIWGFALFTIICIAFSANAQNSSIRPVVLQVANGGFISFKSETSSTSNHQVPGSQSLAAMIYSQALTGENRIIHRVLTDANQRVIFGYDLLVSADPVTKKFSISVLPADEAFRRTFLKPNAPTTDQFATFPNSIKPQLLDDGDAVSLELLVNEKSGLKIVDVVKVTFDRSRLFERSPELMPRDFTLEAVALAIKNYELFIDGQLAGKSKSSFGCSGSLLWFYVPDRGRFIFSLVPREGYSFQKIGILDGNRIEFIVNGQHFEWISSTSILPNGGTWNLWVLDDADYSPLFGERKAPRQKASVLNKITDVVKLGAGEEPKVRLPGSTIMAPQKSSTTPVEVPQRVMIGGADSMDHLLPKTP